MRCLITCAVALATVLVGCAASVPPKLPPVPEQLKVEVVEVLSHDRTAFTEGLELAGSTLYEGTGLSGQSSIRAGKPGQPAEVRAELPAPLFGEGITVLGPTLWQLTWKDGFAIERDAKTLTELRRVRYTGEGWGLCAQPQPHRLVMSNGSSTLTFRDPQTFAVTGSVTVTDRNQRNLQLNELECAGGLVYANVWQTDKIVRIDPATGVVTAEINAAGLLSADERKQTNELNGIAAIPDSDQFLLTGKLWPKMFRVKLVPVSR